MEDIIKLRCRYKDNNYLQKFTNPYNPEADCYLLKTELDYLRYGLDKDGHTRFIDPSGGPFIQEGNVLEEVGKKVKHIEHISDYGWVLTFE